MAEHFVIHKSLSTVHQGSNINLMEKNDNIGVLWVSATERSMMELVSRLEGKLIMYQIVEMSGFLNKKKEISQILTHHTAKVKLGLRHCLCVYVCSCLSACNQGFTSISKAEPN